MRHPHLALAALLACAALLCFRPATPRSYPVRASAEPFPYYRQPDHISCGPTSARMLLEHYGLYASVDRIKACAKTEWFDLRGYPVGMTSPDYLALALKHLGLPVRLRHADLPSLKAWVSEGRPCVVLLRSGRTTWHYAVVVGYAEAEVVVADPGWGCAVTLPTEHFLGAWDFRTGMGGESVDAPCPACGGTGRWLPEFWGPLSVCDLCGGSGRQPDYHAAALRAADITPRTVLVPDAPPRKNPPR